MPSRGIRVPSDVTGKILFVSTEWLLYTGDVGEPHRSKREVELGVNYRIIVPCASAKRVLRLLGAPYHVVGTRSRSEVPPMHPAVGRATRFV